MSPAPTSACRRTGRARLGPSASPRSPRGSCGRPPPGSLDPGTAGPTARRGLVVDVVGSVAERARLAVHALAVDRGCAVLRAQLPRCARGRNRVMRYTGSPPTWPRSCGRRAKGSFVPGADGSDRRRVPRLRSQPPADGSRFPRPQPKRACSRWRTCVRSDPGPNAFIGAVRSGVPGLARSGAGRARVVARTVAHPPQTAWLCGANRNR